MAEFVLVHGAWHGAWCWDELLPSLRACGHGAHAIDLPGSGEDSTPPLEVTLDLCVARIVDCVSALDGEVWLVGHSLGGISISQAAEAVPDRLRGLVYVAAFLPFDDQGVMELSGSDTESRLTGLPVMHAETQSVSIPHEALREVFYQRCSDDQIARARRLLSARQSIAPMLTPLELTQERFGRVPRFYVECLQDQAVSISAQRGMHGAAGVEAVATLDTDHSPFFSCPDELARALDGFSRREEHRASTR